MPGVAAIGVPCRAGKGSGPSIMASVLASGYMC
jgi:hypothetical protein